MEQLAGLLPRRWMTLGFGAIGDALLIVGIVMVAIGKTVSGFTPVIWILLALACYIGWAGGVLLRMLPSSGIVDKL